MMIIAFDGLGDMDESFIDVSALFEERAITSERHLYGAIMFKVAEAAMEAGCLLSDVWVNRIEIDHHEVNTPFGYIWEEIAKLMFWASDKAEWEYMPALAKADEDWNCIEFDELDNERDHLIGVIEDSQSYEDWIREYLSDMDMGIPDHIKEFFDYDAYMNRLRSEYWIIDYEGDEYVFTQ